MVSDGGRRDVEIALAENKVKVGAADAAEAVVDPDLARAGRGRRRDLAEVDGGERAEVGDTAQAPHEPREEDAGGTVVGKDGLHGSTNLSGCTDAVFGDGRACWLPAGRPGAGGMSMRVAWRVVKGWQHLAGKPSSKAHTVENRRDHLSFG